MCGSLLTLSEKAEWLRFCQQLDDFEASGVAENAEFVRLEHGDMVAVRDRSGQLSGLDMFGTEDVESPVFVRRCRVCGCTDDDCSGCVARTGEPCYWVSDDLCSACEAMA